MAERDPLLAPDEEARLLEAARSLDQAALGRIHDACYPFVYRYIAFRVADRDVAEDLANDVFLRLLVALGNGRAPERTLTGWLYGVATHLVQDYYRQRSRQPAVELDEAVPDPGPSPLDRAERALTWATIYEAVAELTEEQQSVIALRFGDGLPIRDVARLIGKTEGAVKQLQARAVAQLASKMTVPDRGRP